MTDRVLNTYLRMGPYELADQTAESNAEAMATSKPFYWGGRCQTCVDEWRADPKAQKKMPDDIRRCRRARSSSECLRCMHRERVETDLLFNDVVDEAAIPGTPGGVKAAANWMAAGPRDMEEIAERTTRLSARVLKTMTSKPGAEKKIFEVQGTCLGCLIRDGVASSVTYWQVKRKAEARRRASEASSAGPCILCSSEGVEPFCSHRMPVIRTEPEYWKPMSKARIPAAMIIPRVGDVVFKEATRGALVREGGCPECSPDAPLNAVSYTDHGKVGRCFLCNGTGEVKWKK